MPKHASSPSTPIKPYTPQRGKSESNHVYDTVDADIDADLSPSTKSRGRPGAKPKLTDGKAALASFIVARGIDAARNAVDEAAKETGLNPQQIRSQLADNRANLRRQLQELAKTLT